MSMRMLCDTGAAVNVLPLRLARKKSMAIDECKRKVVASYAGVVEETRGVVSLAVTLGSITKQLDFDVVASSNEAILSLGALAQFFAVVDCASRTIRLPGNRTIRAIRLTHHTRIINVL